MRLAEYESIRAHLLSLPCARYPDMDALKAAHPGVSLDTLVSISRAGELEADQGAPRAARACHLGSRAAVPRRRGHLRRRARRGLPAVSAHAAARRTPPRRGAQGGGRADSRSARQGPVHPPPESPAGAHHADDLAAGAALCERIRFDVERCVAWDHVASPAVDASRHSAGREYEDLLEEKLRSLGVPFVSEGSLRAEGHAKTPDVKLELPIAVRGRVVNWIDSKASFCDPIVHYERGAEQFQGYVDRFGPGMVVYWLGVVDEIAEESESRGDVLVVDDFPDESEVTKLKLTPRG